MNLYKNIALITSLVVSNLTFSQCYDDSCDDNNDIPVPGCCTATTSGMTWSGYGDIDCVNMGTPTNPDTWMSFTAPTTGYIQITIDNITQDGITQFVVFDHQNAEVCSSLNSFGLLAGAGCNDLPGDGVGGVTSLDTVEYMVEAGERYWLLVSADVENGATPGTFEACINIVPPPPPPPPLPGQDCPTAAILCSGDDFSQGTFSGIGAVENTATNGCLGANERQSKWYTFTVSETGTFEMLVDPLTNSNDYDWALYNTSVSCYSTGSTLPAPISCNFSGCPGNTGITSLDPCTITDYLGCAGNPSTCQAGDVAQFETTVPTLLAGETYTVIIDNFTVSASGFNLLFGGTAVMTPQDYQSEFNAVLDQTNCEATLDLTFGTGIPNYTYEWDFGDGTTSTGADPGNHYYGTPGTYIVELTMTDPLGCTQSYQRIIDVAACTPIPLATEATNFQANIYGNEVAISWTTMTQTEVDYFIVQRSTSIDEWQDVEKVNGAGTTTQKIDYTIIDPRPAFGVSYYRLKEVDFHGESNYSPLRSVKFLNDGTLVKIVNIYGQLVSSQYRGVVYHIYSDGTSKTVIQ